MVQALLAGTNVGEINQTYASGAVSDNGSGINVRSLVGKDAGDVTDSYFDKETVGVNTGSGFPLRTAEALMQNEYSGFDFNNTWFMVDCSTRPFLRWEWSDTITNAHQLQLMAMDLSADYTLANNIDLAPHLTNKSEMWAIDDASDPNIKLRWAGPCDLDRVGF